MLLPAYQKLKSAVRQKSENNYVKRKKIVFTICKNKRTIDLIVYDFFLQGRMDYDPEGKSYYDGDWVNGIKHGWGTRQYPSGNIYHGMWFNNVRHGEGTMKWQVAVVDVDEGVLEGSDMSGTNLNRFLVKKQV